MKSESTAGVSHANSRLIFFRDVAGDHKVAADVECNKAGLEYIVKAVGLEPKGTCLDQVLQLSCSSSLLGL